MKPFRLAPRAVALALSFTFALPNPALALRIEQSPAIKTALEESLQPAAGAEEDKNVVVDLYKLRNEIGLDLLKTLRKPGWSVQFENVVKGLESRTPEKHLVKRSGPDWWIHLHLAFPSDHKGVELTNGLLFRILRNAEGRITGLADPLAEHSDFRFDKPRFFVVLGKPPGQLGGALLSKKDLGKLTAEALETVLRNRESLEARILRNKPSYLLLKSVSQEPSRYSYPLRLLGFRLPPPSIWLMENARKAAHDYPEKPYFILNLPDVWDVDYPSRSFVWNMYKWRHRGVFQRLDLPVTEADEKEKAALLQRLTAAGMEELGYERLLTNPKHHNPERFTYIVHGISPRAGKTLGWIPTPEELQSAHVLSASLIHRDRESWIVSTPGDQGFILSVPDENIFWVSPTDLGMSVRDFLTEQKTLGLLHREKKIVIPPDELIRKSQESQRINDLLSQNELLIEGTNSSGRKIAVAGVFLKEENGQPASFEIQAIRSKIAAWAKKHRLPVVFIQRPTKPQPAGAEEVGQAIAQVMRWDETIRAGTLSQEQFRKEARTFAQQPLFNQSLPSLTGDLVLRFKLLQDMQDFFGLSKGEWGSPFFHLALDGFLKDLALLNLQQIQGTRQVEDLDTLRDELASTQWDRLLRLLQIRWELYEPHGPAPSVHARQTSAGYYFPTDLLASALFLQRAGLQWGDNLLDLGSGSGHVLLAGASVLGLKTYGFEVDPELLRENALWIQKAQENRLIRPGQVQVSPENFLTAPWPAVNAIYHFPQPGEGGMSQGDLKKFEERILQYGTEHPLIRLILVGREQDPLLAASFPRLLKKWNAQWDPELGIVILTPPIVPAAGMEEEGSWSKIEGALEKTARTFAEDAGVRGQAASLQTRLRSLSGDQRLFAYQWLWIHSFPKKADRLETLQLSQVPEAVKILNRFGQLLDGALDNFATSPKVPGTQIRVVKDRKITPSDLRKLEKILTRIQTTNPRLYARVLEQTRTLGLFKMKVLEAGVFSGPFGFTGLPWPNPWKPPFDDLIDELASDLVWGSARRAWSSKYKESDLVRDTQFEFPKWLRSQHSLVYWPRQQTTAYRYLEKVYLDLAIDSFAFQRAWRLRNHSSHLARRQDLRDNLYETAQRLNRLRSPEGRAVLTEAGRTVVEQFRRKLRSLVSRTMVLWMEDLKDADEETRALTVQLLGEIAMPGIHAILDKALQDDQDSVRGAAAGALGNTPYPNSIPILLKLMWDRSQEVRAGAVHSLVRLQPALADLPHPLVRAILTAHPEWMKVSPLPEELQRLRKAVAWLPPEGAKIPLVHGGENYRTLSDPVLLPSWTAEEQVQAVLRLLRGKQLGKQYIHQLTVQGRLPDEFKYAALALILISPYLQDWNEPFMDAPWGKVAPLVHDGGITETSLNFLWRDVEGRTDFLRRVAVVYGPNQPELKAMEQERLLLETKAYQRLALALHAAQGTAPKAEEVEGGIPPDLYKKLADHWKKFRQAMDQYLDAFSGEIEGEKFDLTGAVRVRWFLDKPRELKDWPGPRQEADWDPVRKELLKLNRFIEKDDRGLYNALRRQVFALLKTTTDDIDRDLGLLPPAASPAPAAGMEEIAAQANSGSARVVIGPSAFEMVPGLRRAVEILRRAGMEERFILLPDPNLPDEERRSRLLDAAAKAYGAGSLIGYAAQSDPVMAGFEELLKPGKVSLVRRKPMELKSFVLQILDDVGISAAGSEEAAEEILSAAGIGQAA